MASKPTGKQLFKHSHSFSIFLSLESLLTLSSQPSCPWAWKLFSNTATLIHCTLRFRSCNSSYMVPSWARYRSVTHQTTLFGSRLTDPARLLTLSDAASDPQRWPWKWKGCHCNLGQACTQASITSLGARSTCLEVSTQVDHSVLGQICLTGLEQTGAWKIKLHWQWHS